MRVNRIQAEENRQAVIDAASRLFRERGFDGVGVAELMAAAGLTHGAFYKQFKSKDDLIAQACDRALETGINGWRRAAAEAGEGAYAALVRRYLTPGHRGRVGTGCVIASLGADASRHGPDLPRHFESGVKTFVDILAAALRKADPAATPDDALAAFSTMVGALVLARAVDDDAYARRILEAAVDRLLPSTRA
ncbi:TetR/AcrR family transcriptional regulator [Massilia pinisoli]|uniref:TetR/AcrR family transcriptional regulator n=1 Tax=Massilia pinisoli TaxID=1772194 RepID=A0ABT1ZNE1_9BURK|nr:TetR/AcrR family transcriptional regulator [Massilia pinisoli]MCS0581420.1 TetR/AcrR family transcriptional regulator [Massilia pinisoli]